MDILTSLLTLIIVARPLGHLAERLGQPGVVGEMVAGVLVGPAVFGLVEASEALSGIASLAIFLVILSAQAGDLLRSEGGLVWATLDGASDDIVLERGDVHVVARDGTMRVSAFGTARLEVYGCGPLRFDRPTC